MPAVERVQFPAKFQGLFRPMRYKVRYGGRGGAKSWAYARALLILGTQKKLTILCTREIQKSIADSVHKLLREQIAALKLEGFYRVLETSIHGQNGTEFIFAGLKQNINNLKSYEGVDICWVEEAHTVSKKSWDVLIPTIRKEGSEIWVSFNPELETDETYKRFVAAPPPEADIERVTYADNPYFPEVLRKEMETLRAKSEDDFQHVYGGVCKQMVEGAVYRTELAAAEKESRICRVPYDQTKPVDTFWDLGVSDHTAIVFAQAIAFEFRIIDYVSGCQQGLDYYLKQLQSKAYLYGTHHLPHDAISPTLATGRTVREQLEAVFPGKVKILPRLLVNEGIVAARSLFARCWFDATHCADLLQSLRHYRYELDEKLGTFKQKPLHDWASHAADAFRYFAVAMKEPQREQEQREHERQALGENAWML